MEINNPATDTVIRAVDEIDRRHIFCGGFYEDLHYDEIGGGMIHGYSLLDSAIATARLRPERVLDPDCVAVWEMTIPKGIEYIVGNYNEIVAKEMRLRGIILDLKI